MRPGSEEPADNGLLPLSFNQKALWFIHALSPGSGAYNIASLARVRDVDATALERAFRALVRRHPALRTTFHAVDGEPRQRELAGEPLDFVAGGADGRSRATLLRFLGEEAHRPFDLERPLLRVRLLSGEAGEQWLLVAIHHIVADFWSMAVLVRELAAFYGGEAGGAPVALDPLLRTYREYVLHQQRLLAGPEGDELWSYWRERLAGELPPLELPTDRPRPGVQSYRGDSIEAELDTLLLSRLRSLGRARGATLFAVLLTAFAALLHRLSGEEDLLVGSPSSGRTSREWGGVLGYFVNPVVLRCDLAGEPSFEDLLGRIRAMSQEAFEHRDFPFLVLAERLQPVRRPGLSPIFQVMFGWQKVPLFRGADLSGFALGEEGSRLDLGALSLESAKLDRRSSQFDLTLMAAEGRGRLQLSFQYSTDLFDGTTAERLLGWMGNLLRGITGEPGGRVSDLPLLSEVERHQLVAGWNDVAEAGPCGLLHRLFEEQAGRTPDAPALVCGEAELTYRELDGLAEACARSLERLGVGPEVRVGICLRRSPRMVAALLGVLKAGGAYMPLDPAYPAERLAFLVADSGVALVLTEPATAEALPAAGVPVVDLESLARTAAVTGAMPGPRSGATARNLAYVIYTSGSTGVPKGVAIEHRSASAMVRWALALFPPAELAAVLASTSINFDLSVFELFVPLAAGGTVVLMGSALDLPRAEGVTLVNTVPSVLAELLRSAALPSSVRCVNLAGEPLRRGLVEQLYAGGAERVYNLYGPSEDTTYSTWARMEPGENGAPSIGRPLHGTHAFVVDRALRLVPAGAAGELCLGGVGLARGYLGRPALTAERFVPDPFTGGAGERLYRTGDLARHLPDGRLGLLGRIDHQVKVRGFRIELGEIEGALDRHPEVREAVVTVERDAEGGAELVAFLATAVPGGLPDVELRRFLGRWLPEHMMPSAFVCLEAIPRSPNGKVDRRALPRPERASRRSPGLALPRTPVEETLAGLWAAVLGREEVGVDESFFEIGGHSLKAMQVLSRVRDAFGIELPVGSVFEAPTVGAQALRIEEALRTERRLAQPPLTRASRDQPLPLSFSQQRLWFLDRLEPDSSAYVIPAVLRLAGPCDPAILAASLREILKRHEALRTSLPLRGDGPVQAVSAVPLFLLPSVDLGGLGEPAGEAEARRLLKREAGRSFDLSRGPLVRFLLVRLGGQRHILMVAMHHCVSDGRSLEIFLAELTTLYRALSAGEAPRLPELPVQYADYAVWQRRWLRGEELERQLSYWRRQLAGIAPLELPGDRPRPAVQGFRGATHRFPLPRALAASLRELARSETATLFLVLAAAFQAWLWRYTGQEDLTVGVPVAGRNRSEVEDLIGLFVNTLVLRGRVSGELPFRQTVAGVRRTMLADHAHQDVPFEKLVEELRPERALSRSPLFQVMLSLLTSPAGMDLGGLRLSPMAVERGTAHHDLALEIHESGEELVAGLEYGTDLFDGATVRRMAESLQALLGGICADPDRSLAELPLFGADVRQQLLAEWSGAAAGWEREPACSLHQLFERRAASCPEALAVDGTDDGLTYRELNDRAAQLAHHLRRLGVGPEQVVAIAARRSPAMVIGLLGILKAGAAFLSLDLDDPSSRLDYVLADSRAGVLLSERPLVPRLPGHWPPPILIDELRLDPPTGAVPEQAFDPDHPAYVIYTSGSTGRPKGVVVRHGSVVAYTRDLVVRFGLSSKDRVLQFGSLSFDAIVEEIFPSLAAGAAVVLRGDAGLATPAHLLREAERRGVTMLDLPTGYWHEMVAALNDGCEPPSCLRLVVVGGEKVLAVRWHEWRRRVGQRVRLINTYGPTEATVVATSYEEPIGIRRPREVPIGRPLTTCRTYVLSRDGALVPPGAAGELYLGGEGLARGYLHRPDLTAERFVPNPFAESPAEAGSRLYRTGDLVRYLHGGELEFRGRVDQQVKLRGFRVEPGEIEMVLSGCPGVREAAVKAWQEGPGPLSLAAYLSPREGWALSAAEVRSFLRDRLPGYMVPSAVLLLDQLPHTPSGKIDRSALPAPERDRTEPAEAGHPRTPLQEVIAGVWCDVLGLERVGVAESFFDLGGHSLAATQVTARLHRALRLEVPLRTLFERPTVEGLAEWLDEALREPGAVALPPLEPAERTTVLPLSFGQERLWFLDRFDPGSPAYNLPAALRCRGPLDVAALAAALSAVAARHEVLRTSFAERSGMPVQRIAPHTPVLLPRVDLRGLPAPRREGAALDLADGEARRPFDLAGGPLLRAALVVLGEESHLMLLTFHHIVADGWSLEVFARELSGLYADALEGRASSLQPLPVQYADFAVWQRGWLRGEILERRLAYWRRQLGGLAPLDLPLDRPRPPVSKARGGKRPLGLPPALVTPLLALSRRAGATLFLSLLGAFQLLLARCSGQDDIAVGTPVAGRGRPELEPLIGFFLNTLVLRCDLSGNSTFLDLLARVREAFLGAYAHDLPFEKLVEELQPERDLSQSPLFQVMLTLQSRRPPGLALAGLEFELRELDSGAAKFDLTLSLEERAGGAEGWLEYNLDLFDPATVDLLSSRFTGLLAELAGDPRRPLSDVPLLSAAERHQLLVEWNDTPAALPPADCIHHLFELQAESRPAATAVVCGERAMTYRELDRRAGELARRLRRLGVGPEVLVGVLLERGLDLVVAVLAVLKAGGAYVPLDPGHPAERLAFMLNDAGAAVLLTGEGLLARLPAGGLPVVTVDGGAETPGAAETGRFSGPAGAENLAYVIYTSGSTGRPKGVQIPHRAVVSFLASMAKRPGLTAGDTLLAVTTLSFDIAGLELFLPLSVGGRIVISPQGGARPDELMALLDRSGIDGSGISAMQATPATWQLLKAAGWPGSPGLKVLCGGEALPSTLASWLLGAAGSVWNVYGPTETTIWSTCQRLAPGEPVAVGRPIDNTEVHVLSPDLQLVPRGAPGELSIGGMGLSRGYRGRPDLTAERFVPNPFGDAGARLYRTGDLVRQRPDGRLDYLGRIDHQAKLRGHRIEPGEIEAALTAYPGLGEAVVVVRPDAAGEPILVAYVVPSAPEEAPDLPELVRRLRQVLPEPMIPAAFVTLPTLPRNTSGKVDRRALPAPGPAGEGREQPFVAPRTPTEAALAQIWSELLGVQRVGAEDHFFQLGGHSLKAIQLASRVRDSLGVEIPLRTLFTEPRLCDLASFLDGRRGQPAEPAAIAAQPRGRHGLEQILNEVEKLSRTTAAKARVLGSGARHE